MHYQQRMVWLILSICDSSRQNLRCACKGTVSQKYCFDSDGMGSPKLFACTWEEPIVKCSIKHQQRAVFLIFICVSAAPRRLSYQMSAVIARIRPKFRSFRPFRYGDCCIDFTEELGWITALYLLNSSLFSSFFFMRFVGAVRLTGSLPLTSSLTMWMKWLIS